jgi:predicted lactoylglutathione lyase
MSAVPERLSLVTLGARDFPRLRDFYLGLGWTPRVSVDDFIAFLVGGVILGIYPLELLTEEAAPGKRANGEWSGVTLACNVATRDEVDDAWEAWVAAGATPLYPPFDREYGPRTGYVTDPEGNRWEIGWANGLEFDERGAVTAFWST